MAIKTEALEFLKENQSEKFTVTQIAKSIKRARDKVVIRLKELVKESTICQKPYPAINGKTTYYQYSMISKGLGEPTATASEPTAFLSKQAGSENQCLYEEFSLIPNIYSKPTAQIIGNLPPLDRFEAVKSKLSSIISEGLEQKSRSLGLLYTYITLYTLNTLTTLQSMKEAESKTQKTEPLSFSEKDPSTKLADESASIRLNNFALDLINSLESIFEKSLPDEIRDKAVEVVRSEIVPLFRSPVKAAEGDPALKPIQESSVPTARQKERAKKAGINVKSFVRMENRLKDELKGKGIKAGIHVFLPRTDPVTRAKQESLNKSDFKSHVRYYGIDPDHRSYEFAKVWVRVVQKLYPTWKPYKGVQINLSNFLKFIRSGDYYISATKARIEADLLGARYEDYIAGLIQYHLENRRGDKHPPKFDDAKGSAHVEYAKNYIDIDLKAHILITKSDLKFSGCADFLFSKNFDPENPNPKSLVFYQDVLFTRLEQIATTTGHELWELVRQCIEYGVMPQIWAEGYGKFHRLAPIEKFTHGSCDPYLADSLFKNVML